MIGTNLVGVAGVCYLVWLARDEARLQTFAFGNQNRTRFSTTILPKNPVKS